MSGIKTPLVLGALAAVGVALHPVAAQLTTTPTLSGLVARVTSAGAGSVSWSAFQGATSYLVVRWNTADPSCCKALSPPSLGATTLSWQDGTLPLAGTYAYRVYATTPTGTYAGEVKLVYNSGVASNSDPNLRSSVTAAGGSGGGTALSSGPTSTLSRPSGSAEPMNTGPAPSGLQITGGVTTASLQWDPVAGATGYRVARALAGTTGWMPLTPSAITATSYSSDPLPDPRATYTYQVTAVQADGHYGVATRNYAPPPPSDPTEFSAAQTAEHEVELSWRDTPGVTKYLISGPGAPGTPVSSNAMTLGIIGVSGKSSYKLAGVANGVQSWTIASAYAPGGVLTTADKWPKATLTVGSLSGKYRVTIIGFDVNAQTVGDPFTDGLGDEVYLVAHVSTFNLSTGAVGVQGVIRSFLFGDVTNLPGRVKAGTLSQNGGLKSGDAYPLSGGGTMPPVTPEANTVPMLLWEGQLTNDVDLLLIAPSVWESDGNDAALSDWSHWIETGAHPLNYQPLQNEITATGITPIRHSDASYVGTLRGPGVDHPIGIVTVSSTTSTTYAQMYLALTRRKIEAALSPSSTVGGLAPGVLAVPLKDLYSAEGFGGAYTVYLRVERLP